jgi:cytochrome c556
MRVGKALAVTLVGAGLAIGISGGIAAQTDTAALVKERQDNMRKMGGALFGQIGKIVRGENPNVTEAAAHAATADALAKDMLKQFPPKTDRAAVPTSRAKPEVWAQWTEFQSAANAFSAETAKLSEVAKTGNLDAIKAQFAATAKACGGCHEAKADAGGKFRFEKE